MTSNTGIGCSYDYDRYGNRWHQNTYNGSCLTPSYSFSSGNNRIDSFTYDSAGNVLNDGSHTYTYDAENRLKTVDGGTTYKYDAAGRRIKRAAPSENVEYIYDLQGRAVTVVNSSGTWVRGEIFAGNLHIATYVNGTTEFSHSDWLGTERVRTNTTASGDQYFTGYPFGEGNSGGNSPLHFTSKELDSESSLSYFGARYYRNASGRFNSPDWSADPTAVPYASLADPQSLNLFTYVRNNPITAVDPSGHLSRQMDNWGVEHPTDGGIDGLFGVMVNSAGWTDWSTPAPPVTLDIAVYRSDNLSASGNRSVNAALEYLEKAMNDIGIAVSVQSKTTSIAPLLNGQLPKQNALPIIFATAPDLVAAGQRGDKGTGNAYLPTKGGGKTPAVVVNMYQMALADFSGVRSATHEVMHLAFGDHRLPKAEAQSFLREQRADSAAAYLGVRLHYRREIRGGITRLNEELGH